MRDTNAPGVFLALIFMLELGCLLIVLREPPSYDSTACQVSNKHAALQLICPTQNLNKPKLVPNFSLDWNLGMIVRIVLIMSLKVVAKLMVVVVVVMTYVLT